MEWKEFSELLGKTLIKIENKGDEVFFYTSDGGIYIMYHDQDCCEGVSIDDINGDLEDLLNSPITLAEESTSSELQPFQEYEDESFTWTFYKLATMKGYVDIRWYGQSNGYYSEGVSFAKINNISK